MSAMPTQVGAEMLKALLSTPAPPMPPMGPWIGNGAAPQGGCLAPGGGGTPTSGGGGSSGAAGSGSSPPSDSSPAAVAEPTPSAGDTSTTGSNTSDLSRADAPSPDDSARSIAGLVSGGTGAITDASVQDLKRAIANGLPPGAAKVAQDTIERMLGTNSFARSADLLFTLDQFVQSDNKAVTTGGLAGAWGGAKAGAALCAPGGPYAAALCAIGGGLAGGPLGEFVTSEALATPERWDSWKQVGGVTAPMLIPGASSLGRHPIRPPRP